MFGIYYYKIKFKTPIRYNTKIGENIMKKLLLIGLLSIFIIANEIPNLLKIGFKI